MDNPFIYLYFPIILLEILEFTSTNKHKKIEFSNTAEFKFYEKNTRIYKLANTSPRSHGLVVRAVASGHEARGPGFDSSSDQNVFFSSGIRR